MKTERALIESSPKIPLDGGEPVFREPWEAQAFAMTVRLYERGLFIWTEWAQALGAEIAGAGDRPSDYYRLWLSALEKLVAAKSARQAGRACPAAGGMARGGGRYAAWGADRVAKKKLISLAQPIFARLASKARAEPLYSRLTVQTMRRAPWPI